MQTSTRKSQLRVLVLVCALVTVGGCSTAPVKKGEPVEPVFSADRVLIEGVTYADDIWDPWEGFNRTIYRFNYRFDRYVLLPAVRAYRAVLPDPVERSVHNFFENIRNVSTLINSILQLRPEAAADTLTRLIWNSTVGVLGLFDVATALDVPNRNETFGQTLGYWGLGPGPYLVVPLLGPASTRNAIGLGVDWWVTNAIRDQAFELDTWQSLLWTGLDVIDTRANIPFRYFETGSPFEYELVRWLVNTKEEIEIAR